MPSGEYKIKSLLDTCLGNVTQNMDSLWCKDYVENYARDKKFYKYVLGPFETIRKLILILLYKLNYKCYYINFSSFQAPGVNTSTSERRETIEETLSRASHHPST